MITRFLMDKDKTLQLHNESEWGNPGGEGYTAFNSGGVECEVGEFLYGLVRMIKPERVLETGTHQLVGASYIGEALHDNGFGHLTTLEYIPENVQIATMRLQVLGLNDFVDVVLTNALRYKTDCVFDLILLDTEPQTRFQELIKFFPNLKDGGYVFIHDLNRHMSQVDVPGVRFAFPFGALPDEIIRMVKKDYLRPFHFSTPRGLTGFYKVKGDDYKW